MQFTGLDPQEARAFAARWLPAWTGNQPERLLAFYTDDAFYSDPAIPDGVRGRSALRAYFTKLLSLNPEWIWHHEGSIPMRDGFLNQWRAAIPVGESIIDAVGVCTVQLRDGLIYCNQVYFDRAGLLAAIRASR